MPVNKFYPRLSSIIKVDNLPDSLSFFQDGLNSIFDKLFFRDFQSARSANGDNAFYSLIIVSHKRIGIDIPGTGFALVLNPGHSGTSEIPVTLRSP